MSSRQAWIAVFALTVFGPDVFAADMIDPKEARSTCNKRGQSPTAAG